LWWKLEWSPVVGSFPPNFIQIGFSLSPHDDFSTYYPSFFRNHLNFCQNAYGCPSLFNYIRSSSSPRPTLGQQTRNFRRVSFQRSEEGVYVGNFQVLLRRLTHQSLQDVNLLTLHSNSVPEPTSNTSLIFSSLESDCLNRLFSGSASEITSKTGRREQARRTLH